MAGNMWILKGMVMALLLPLMLSEGQVALPAQIPQGIMPSEDGAGTGALASIDSSNSSSRSILQAPFAGRQLCDFSSDWLQAVARNWTQLNQRANLSRHALRSYYNRLSQAQPLFAGPCTGRANSTEGAQYHPIVRHGALQSTWDAWFTAARNNATLARTLRRKLSDLLAAQQPALDAAPRPTSGASVAADCYHLAWARWVHNPNNLVAGPSSSCRARAAGLPTNATLDVELFDGVAAGWMRGQLLAAAKALSLTGTPRLDSMERLVNIWVSVLESQPLGMADVRWQHRTCPADPCSPRAVPWPPTTSTTSQDAAIRTPYATPGWIQAGNSPGTIAFNRLCGFWTPSTAWRSSDAVGPHDGNANGWSQRAAARLQYLMSSAASPAAFATLINPGVPLGAPRCTPLSAAAAASPASTTANCTYGVWSGWGGCTRVDTGVWARQRSRNVTRGGTACRATSESMSCEPAPTPAPSPSLAMPAALSAITTAIPISLQAGLSPDEAPDNSMQPAALSTVAASSSKPAPAAAPGQQAPSDALVQAVIRDAMPSTGRATASSRRQLQADTEGPAASSITPFNGDAATLTKAVLDSIPLAQAAQAAGLALAHTQVVAAVAAEQQFRAARAAAGPGATPPSPGAGVVTPANVTTPRAAGGLASTPPAASSSVAAPVSTPVARSATGQPAAAAVPLGVLQLHTDGYLQLALEQQPSGASRLPPGFDRAVVASMMDTVLSLQPWMTFKLRGTLPPVHTTMAIQLDPLSKTIGVQATTRQVRALLHAFRAQFEALGITRLPAFNASIRDSAATTSQLVLGTDSGLQLLSVPLTGSLTVSRALGTVGLPWPFADDVVVLADAKMQLRPLAGSFSVDADISIPSLGVSAQPGAVHWRRTSAAVEWYGEVKLLKGVKATNLALTASTTELTGSGMGQLADIQVQLTATLTRSRGLSLSLSGSDVGLGGVARGIFRDALKLAVPGVLLDFLDDLRFASVVATVGKEPGAAATYDLVASPHVPEDSALSDILGTIGLQPSDITLLANSQGLAFGIQKTITFSMPRPFSRNGASTIALLVGNKGMEFSADLTTWLVGDWLANEVGFNIAVKIGVPLSKKPTAGVLVGISGTSLAPITIKGMPFLSIHAGVLAGEVIIRGKAVTPRMYKVSGGSPLFGRGYYEWDEEGASVMLLEGRSGPTAALGGALEVLAGLGINLKLPFPMVPSVSGMARTTKPVPELNLTSPGVYWWGSMDFMGIQYMFNTTITMQGFTFEALLDVSKAVEVLLKPALAAVKQSMRAADSYLQSNQEEQAAKARAAQRDVEAAENALKAVNATFRALEQRTTAGVSSAQAVVNSAQAAYNAKRDAAMRDLDKARANYNAADRVFEQAKAAAASELDGATGRVNSAKAEWDKVSGSAQRALDDAQAYVDRCTSEYNKNNKRCKRNPPNLGACIRAGEWAAKREIAKAGLAAARGVWDRLIDSSARKALNSANSALSSAQSSFNAVLSGTQKASRDAAAGLLAAAQAAVDKLGDAAEAAAFSSASKTLEAARAAANAILTSAEWLSLQSAEATLKAAQEVLIAYRKASDGVSNSLQDVARGIASLDADDFAVLQRAELRVGATLANAYFGLNLDLVLAGDKTNVRVNVNVDKPLQAALDALGKAIKDALAKQGESLGGLL